MEPAAAVRDDHIVSVRAMSTREAIIGDVDPVTVLIVDDQPPFRAVARTVVAMTTGFEVVAELDSGEAAVAAVADLRPAMVLMDINLGGINGIEATRGIIDTLPETVVVLLSTYDVDSLPLGASECGAARYVHKEDLSPKILQEIWDHRVRG